MNSAPGSVLRPEMLAILTRQITEVVRPHPVRVAIDGIDGAGKTRLADELVPHLEQTGRPVIRASMDGFHKSRAIRYARGRYSPEGYYRDSFNLEALVSDLLLPLGPGGSRSYRRAVFDYRHDVPLRRLEEEAAKDAVLLFDGVFLHRPELVGYWDLTMYLHIGFDLLVERLAERDRLLLTADRDLIRRYVEGQKLYLAECVPREKADVLIDNSDVRWPVLHRISV